MGKICELQIGHQRFSDVSTKLLKPVDSSVDNRKKRKQEELKEKEVQV